MGTQLELGLRREQRVGPVARMTDEELSEKRFITEVRREASLVVVGVALIVGIIAGFTYYTQPGGAIETAALLSTVASAAVFLVALASSVVIGRRLALLDNEDTVRARRFFDAVSRIKDEDLV